MTIRGNEKMRSRRRYVRGRAGMGVRAVLLIGMLTLPQGAFAATNPISTVAGGKVIQCHIDPNSDPEWPDWICDFDNGDGGSATAALLKFPSSVAAMPDGGVVGSSPAHSEGRRGSPPGADHPPGRGGPQRGFPGRGPARAPRPH